MCKSWVLLVGKLVFGGGKGLLVFQALFLGTLRGVDLIGGCPGFVHSLFRSHFCKFQSVWGGVLPILHITNNYY